MIRALKQLVGKLYICIPIIREMRQIRDAVLAMAANLSSLRTMEAIRVVDFEIGRNARYRNPKRLLGSNFQVFSQNGEDGIIREIFARIGSQNDFFVEIGVGDGLENNTQFLLSQGWSGFWFDGSGDFISVAKRHEELSSGTLNWSVSFITRENVANLFRQFHIPIEFDLLSIDVDQNTYYVWEGLRDFKPRVVVIEYNAVIPPDMVWKVDYGPKRVWDGTHNFGASLKSLEHLGRQLGYSLVGCDLHGINAFFVRNDLLDDKFEAPYTAENHFEPARYAMRHRRSHVRGILDKAARCS